MTDIPSATDTTGFSLPLVTTILPGPTPRRARRTPSRQPASPGWRSWALCWTN